MEIGSIGKIFLCSVAVSIVAGLLIYRAKNWLSTSRYSIGLLVGGVFALALTWFLLFWFVTLTTGRLLAPWDQWAGFAPPPSTWQRQLNDFFRQDTYQYLTALLIVGISGILFLAGMLTKTRYERSKLPLAFAFTNLTYLVFAFLILILAGRLPDLWLPQPRPSIDVGYHRTWPEILLQGVLLGMLFWSQYRLISSSLLESNKTGGGKSL